MTHEEIDEARDIILRDLRALRNGMEYWVSFPTEETARSAAAQCEKSMAHLDALCEAAKAAQPEDLVGRRVQIKQLSRIHSGHIGVVEKYQRPLPYLVVFSDGVGWGTFNRDDFEPIDEPQSLINSLGGQHKMKYEVLQDKTNPFCWRVEAIDHQGDGECYVTVFSGAAARERAVEYAAWRQGSTS